MNPGASRIQKANPISFMQNGVLIITSGDQPLKAFMIFLDKEENILKKVPSLSCSLTVSQGPG